MSKTIILSEEKFNRIIRKTLKEEDVYNNYEAFKSQVEGEGDDDGTPEHNVGMEFDGETRDANLYPGFNEMI